MVVECASRMRCRCSGVYSPPDAEAPTEDTAEGALAGTATAA